MSANSPELYDPFLKVRFIDDPILKAYIVCVASKPRRIKAVTKPARIIRLQELFYN